MSNKSADRQLIFGKKSKKPLPQRGKNYLLVIGIDKYTQVTPLQNAVRDARAVVKILLDRYKFERENVVELFDEQASREAIINALDILAEKVTDKDNLLIYFAGHGYFREKLKLGYWVPFNAQNGHFAGFINHSTIRDYIRAIPAHHIFMIVDSCFSGNLLRDLTPTVVHANRVDRFPSRWCLAAGMIEKVSDGYVGDHSPFARSLITYLKANDEARFPVQDLINHVSKATSYNADQTPIGGVILKTGDQNGQFVFDLKEEFVGDVVELDNEIEEVVQAEFLSLEMVVVEGGSSPFEIGRYPVTQALWNTIMGNNPSHFKACEDCPVEQVSWHEVQGFLKKLNDRYPDMNYRLPSEAEWELAGRGGNHSRGFSFAGSNQVQQAGWFFANSDEQTHPVGQKAANELGIHDMSGNVWEWCKDPYDSDNQDESVNEKTTSNGYAYVLKGGSWGSAPDYLKPDYKFSLAPESKSSLVGFPAREEHIVGKYVKFRLYLGGTSQIVALT